MRSAAIAFTSVLGLGRCAAGSSVEDVLRDWNAFVYRELGALHHFDLQAGSAVYRAFLLGELLEVDLGFTPVAAFGPLGSGDFRLVFGQAVDRQPGTASPGHLIGLAWHHVLHARTSIERGALWQAEYWISGIRDHTLALACVRLGLPASYAKGADQLPAAVTARVQDALVRALAAAATLEGALLDLAAVSGDSTEPSII